MTTNINFYGKPFGAPLLPNKMTSDGWSIADARHIGGHRVVDTIDDLYELYDWQLVNPSALLNNDTDSAVGQKWYVKGDGTYMLKNYAAHNSSAGWVKVEDIDGSGIIPDTGSVNSVVVSNKAKISTLQDILGSGANKANGAIVLDADGRIPSTVKTAFKTINGQSILKTNGGASDITIDFSLFILVASQEDLPAVGEPNKIYIVPGSRQFPNSTNKYVEYIYVNNGWEELGEYRAEIPIKDYLKKTDAEATYVKQSAGSPSTYILNSSDSLHEQDMNSSDVAASVKLLFNVEQNLERAIGNCSRTDHTHEVTINGATKTIGNKTIDLGTYATPDSVRTTLSTFTYDKTTIDNKVKAVTAPSLGIATLTNTEIDTMFTQIFG